MKKFYFSLACLALIGCGDSNIDIVKKATLSQNKTMTIGDAIDSFKECESVKWEDTSKNKQNIVTVTCKIKSEILKDEFNQINAEYQKALDAAKQRNQEMIENTYNIFKDNLQSLSKTDVKFPSIQELLELAKKHCKLNKNESFFSLSMGECDESTDEELKNFNYEPRDSFFKIGLDNYLLPILRYSQEEIKPIWFKELPKEVKSRTYKINFFVNTDKSVACKDAFVINDGEEKEIRKNELLYKFYER